TRGPGRAIGDRRSRSRPFPRSAASSPSIHARGSTPAALVVPRRTVERPARVSRATSNDGGRRQRRAFRRILGRLKGVVDAREETPEHVAAPDLQRLVLRALFVEVVG